MEKRIVKIPMPADLIRRMDQALAAGRGGLETREQVLREAAEGLLAELTYPQAPPEPVPPAVPMQSGSAGSDASALLEGVLNSIPSWEQEELRLADLAGSALGPVPAGATLAEGVAQPTGEPPLGLHNRDYPSLWAASRLAHYSQEGVIPVEKFKRRVTAAAWYYGAQLRALEQGSRGLRLTPIFPTNPEKREAAEQGFQSFALGEIPRRVPPEGKIRIGGPLFDWGLCQLVREEGDLLIGLTQKGRSLLQGLVGLSLALPHEEAMADLFLRHLVADAHGERWGFERILTLAREEPSREELVAAIAEERSDWSAATASSIAQGYVARAREWGLLEPRLQQGRYRLTGFGERWQHDLAAPPKATANDGEVQS
jgi:hypothetical protein